MRGLTIIERTLIEDLLKPFDDDHDVSVPYTSIDMAAYDRLYAQGRVEPYQCSACGAWHPQVTTAGLEALRLDKAIIR